MGLVLSPQQLKQYNRDGILFPVGALPAEQAQHYFNQFLASERIWMEQRGQPLRSQLHLHFPWAYELATHPVILDAVAQIIGENILLHSSSLFCKHPGDDQYVSFHQDGHYWGLSEPQLVSAWIALSEVTPASGCMRVAPGTHQDAVAHNNSALDNHNMLGSGLSVEAVPQNVVDVTLKAGEMSLHHVNLVHGSAANRATHPRVGFAVRYLAAHVTQRGVHHEVQLLRGSASQLGYELAPPPQETDLEKCCAHYQQFLERFQALRMSQGRPKEAGAVVE